MPGLGSQLSPGRAADATELTDWRVLQPGGSITSFGEDAAGELYLMSANGGVFKIVPEP